MCAPPDEEFAARLAVSACRWCHSASRVRAMVTGATPRSAADLPRRGAKLIAAQFDTVALAAEGCDALVATGVLPGYRQGCNVWVRVAAALGPAAVDGGSGQSVSGRSSSR